MPHIDLLFPSKYVKCADLMGKKITKTIKKVAMDTLTRQGGAKEKKPVIWFSDSEKMLVLNRTNAKAIASLYGPVTEDWVGKQITLKPARDRFGAEMVDCVRIDLNGHAKANVAEKTAEAHGLPGGLGFEDNASGEQEVSP